MAQPINIFAILNVKRQEDPHDRVVAWLCDPEAGHAMTGLAASIISRLWGRECTERVRRVKRQFKLRDDSWPDVAVEFDASLLLIENKVNTSSLQKGQLELQHELAKAHQKGASLFHCLLCPDLMAATGISLQSDAFRVLRYSTLAELITSQVTEHVVPEARPIVEQYVEFIRSSLALPAPRDVKLASAAAIADRNCEKRDTWSEEEFLKQAEMHGGSGLVAAQESLLELLRAMEDVEPKFESKGKGGAYTIRLTEGDVGTLVWVYANGQIFPFWESFRKAGDQAAASRMRGIWAPYVKGPDNPNYSETVDRLGFIKPELIAELLQRTAETTSQASAKNG